MGPGTIHTGLTEYTVTCDTCNAQFTEYARRRVIAVGLFRQAGWCAMRGVTGWRCAHCLTAGRAEALQAP